MKFTLSWLKDHLETEASLDEITEALTALGLEVEGVHNPAETLAPFHIAHVLEAGPHPDADKLRVLKVDTGRGEPVQVVCGAPNARAGMKGVFAAEGSYVPGTGITLKPTKIRGVPSNGMMVSERELELSDEHSGIIELAEDAPTGTSYAEWAGLDDPVIEIGITPNRQDCLSVHGIARDLAAAGLGVLKEGTIELVEGNFDCPIDIRVEDSEGCPAFFGRVLEGVSNGPAPAWMQQRLRAIGLRPISALVDITNYVTFDRGRPLHVYDLAKLKGGLTARKAKAGESVLALNGKTYELEPFMTVIADEAHVHDIGGIMGGEESSVSEETTDIVVECAYFDPVAIAKTGMALNLHSDARARFERGVDPGFLRGGLALATDLIMQVCGGKPSRAVHAGTPPDETRLVSYDPALCASLSGVDVPEAEQADILSRLGFEVDQGPVWSIGVPTWRRDVDGAPDLVEEVVRIHGYDRIPSTPLPRSEGVAKPTATPEQLTERRLRRALAARGLDEAVTYSFVSDEEAAAFGGADHRLDNPISADLVAMKRSVLPSLVSAARSNLDRGSRSARLFEIARRYLSDGERPTAGILLAGLSREKDWRTGGEAGFDVFDAKAELTAALEAAGAPTDKLQVQRIPADADSAHWYHPGRSGRLMLGPKTCLGEFGELHPRVTRAFDLSGRVAAAELFLDALPRSKAKRSRPAFTPPALQAVTRDFAFLMDADRQAAELVRACASADKKAVTGARLFDYFQGEGVPEGKVSAAVRVTLQPQGQSFTDEDITAISEKVVAAAKKAVGAELR